jgi:phospholipase/carboxylesterase
MPNMNHWRTDRLHEGFDYAAEPMLGLPIRTKLPDTYEPGYAYPLLVLFHGRGGNEEQVLRIAPKISTQNFVYLSIRGPQPLGKRTSGQKGFGWEHANAETMFGEYVRLAVQLTRRTYHIHSERVYLVGVNEGCEAAYRAGFALAGQVAGIVALNGAMPRNAEGRPAFNLADASQLRLFIGQGVNASESLRTAMDEDFALLDAAGANVRKAEFNSEKIHASTLREINHWVVDAVNAEHDLYAVRD